MALLIGLAKASNSFLSKIYNKKFEIVLRVNEKKSEELFQYYEKLWSMEECIIILKDCAILGVSKDLDNLDSYVR